MSSSLKKVVLLVVSLLLMQVNLGLAANNTKSISVEIAPPKIPGALQFGFAGVAAAGFSVAITLGGTAFTMLADTSGFDTWVVSTACTDIFCRTRVRYAQTATFQVSSNQRVSLNYLSNKFRVSGVTGRETLVLTPALATVVDQDFIRVSSTVGFLGEAFDGFIGLAPGKNIRNRASLIEKLSEKNIISSKTFTIHTGATLLDFGDVPAAYTGAGVLNYVKIVNKGIWDFRASNVDLDNNLGAITSIAKNAYFRIETLVAGFGIPKSSLTVLARALNIRLVGTQYQFPCATAAGFPDLVLTINGVLYAIPQANYVTPTANAAICTLNVVESSSWILGRAFFTLFATTFNGDTNQIGFANIP